MKGGQADFKGKDGYVGELKNEGESVAEEGFDFGKIFGKDVETTPSPSSSDEREDRWPKG